MRFALSGIGQIPVAHFNFGPRFIEGALPVSDMGQHTVTSGLYKQSMH